MTDSSKLDQLAQYSAVDPITDAQLVRRGEGEAGGMCAARHAAGSASLLTACAWPLRPAPPVPLWQISPPVKLGIALGVLFLAIMAYAQSVRLSVHVGEPGGGARTSGELEQAVHHPPAVELAAGGGPGPAHCPSCCLPLPPQAT